MERVKIGDQFGHWTVVGESIFKGNHIRHWLCKCACGTERYVGQYFLLNNRSRSCGCTKEYSGPHFQDNSLRWCLRQKGAGNERTKAQKLHQSVQDESCG